MRQYRHRRSENPSAAWPNPMEPGELAVNTSNLQLAVGDAAFGLSLGAPIELLPVRFFSTRAMYLIGAIVVEGASFYRANEAIVPGPFNASQWTLLISGGGSGGSNLASDIIFVPGSTGLISTNVQDALEEMMVLMDGKVNRSGDVMTGFLTLHAPPVDAMHAVNKAYMDALLEGGVGTGRKSAMVPWTHVNMRATGGGTGGIEEAPTDDKIYGRLNEAWYPVPIQADAPADAQEYARKNNGWVVVGGGVGEVAPYVRKIGDVMTGDLQMTTDALIWSASGAGLTSVTSGGALGHKLQICDSGVSLFEWNGYWQGGSLVMNAQGALICVWAAKPGGGDWATTSDARIKNVHGPYNRTLADVVQLNPVLYNYIGNDTRTAEITPTDAKKGGAPYRESQTRNVSETTFAGLIAQEVELVFPEMVSQREGYVDGELVTDMRDLDTSPLIFALVNAIKELKARIEVLEAA